MFFSKSRANAFTVVEVTIMVTVIAFIATIGLIAANRAVKGSQSAKLLADVESINGAVRVYLAQGGNVDIGAAEDPNLVISKLRTKLSAEDAESFVGLKGSMVDPRLRAVMLSADEEKSSTPRAIWDKVAQRFVVATSGSGIKEFALDAAPVITEQTRDSSFEFAKDSNWIWDYGDSSRSPRSTFVEPELSPAETATSPGSAASQTELIPPSINIPGGTYDYAHYPLLVSLSDSNAPGRSRILYQINEGSWNVYTGSSVVIPPDGKTTLVAYCESGNPDLWSDSISSVEIYDIMTFSGKSEGEFLGATGSSEMVISYEKAGEDALFLWGDPAVESGYIRPSELVFVGSEFSAVTLEKEFVLGTLTYFNGTISQGTGADDVDLEVGLDLAFDVEVASSAISFELELINTLNDWENQTEDQNADYVRLSVPEQGLEVTIDGVNYYVHLSFGDSGARSFTTDSTFHVWENEEAEGVIVAKISQTPPGDEDRISPSAVLSARSSLVAGQFNVDVSFSEYVTGLTAGDFSITNGSASGVSGDGYHFVLGVTPVTDGTVSVGLPEGAAFDLAGNGNTASNSVILTVDKTPPTLQLLAAPAANGNFIVDAIFSEPVVGLNTFDWETRNGVVNSVTGAGAEYKTHVIPGGIGNVFIGLKAGAVTDLVGHSVKASAEIAVLFDPIAPEAVLSLETADANPTVSGMFSVNVELTDAVADIDLTDFVISNGVGYTIVESDPANYTISIVPHVAGTVSLYLAGDSVHDLAGNGNLESNTVSVNYAAPDSSSEYIDFDDYEIQSWGSILFIPQDQGDAKIQGGGKELRVDRDAWKSINYSYTVTPNTVVEFEFKGKDEGEIHGIGFDNDVDLSPGRIFQVYGTQEFGIQDFHNYSGQKWRTFSIPVGQHYTGDFDRMFFIADKDLDVIETVITGSESGKVESRFRNVRVYEQ